MKRYLLQLSYDGSGFCGWQKQLHFRTVQNELETALHEIAKQHVKTIGSSRTDTGVHALCQYTHFDFPIDLTPIQIKLALTTKLPKDIKVNNVFIVQPDFHSRYHATGRSYRFEITKELTPFNRNFRTYFPRYPVYPEAIEKCLSLFEGKQDFELFSHKNEKLTNHLCNVKNIGFVQHDEGYTFTITANRFLHNMVRRIIGTMVKLGNNDDLPHIISELLKKNEEYLHMVYTAPPQGLFLSEVFYPPSTYTYSL